LLGYILDPGRPERTSEAVLAAILDRLTGGADPFSPTFGLGGRWILILSDGTSTTIFTDPCGLRQLFYSDSSLSESWCASQPFHIARALGLPIDLQVKVKFLHSAYVARDPEYWFPGDASPYLGVRRLLPNHALDLATRVCRRFWPSQPIAPIELEEAVVLTGRLLTGQIEAANQRFPLALPITAGYDSRTVMAATQSIAQNVYYYTALFPYLSRSHPDIRVPNKLLAACKLEHHVIECPSEMSSEFRAVYAGNSDPYHPRVGAIAEGLFNSFPADKVSVSTHGSEIVRGAFYYEADRYPRQVTPETLARDVNMLDDGCPNPFAVEQFDQWLQCARTIERDYGVLILELFFWEQRVGSWAAAGQAEWDIVHERLSPFSCRNLLAMGLGLGVKERDMPECRLHTGIMAELWPELLAFPLNPPPLTAISLAIRASTILHIKAPMRAIYRLIKRVQGAPHR
jgi:hypothetical protein